MLFDLLPSLVLGTFALILSVLLFFGKCLRLVAGNTFLSKSEIDTDAQRSNARYVAGNCLAAAVVCYSLTFFLLAEHGVHEYKSEATVAFVVSMTIFVASLVVVLLRTKKLN